MTPAQLRTYRYKDLAQMAKREGVGGWHSMRKEELIRALVKQSRRAKNGKATPANGKSRPTHRDPARHRPAAASGQTSNASAARRPNGEVRRKLHALQASRDLHKNLVTPRAEGSNQRTHDRLVVMVRDPYWLHAYWEVTQQSVDRAQSALGQYWHAAQPVLRLFRIEADGSATFERQIVVHGGVNNWYVDVQEPPCSFRLEIGYFAKGNAFYCLARSNTVTTPPAGTSDSVDDNWTDVAENADRIFAMSGGYSPQGTSLELQELLEERLRRPMGSPMQTRYGNGAARAVDPGDVLPFAIDAELVVYGVSHAHAHVTIKGEPVQVRPDGTFAVRLSLPERRQVVPVVASSVDGVEQRTIILAIERNTKVLEPVLRDPPR